jgi:hypothetical protein
MDDWENIDENDFVISLSEKKKLEERKMQEDADHDLTNELFSNHIETNKNNTNKQPIEPVKVVETNKPPKLPRQIHTNKPQPKKEKRITKDDVFGSCELDKYEDKYCEMEDNILNK